MIRRIMLLLLIIIPIAEYYLLVELGAWIGALNTIAIVIVSALVGLSFSRNQGKQIIVRIKNTTHQGQIPGRELVEAVLVVLGGFLLIFPGLITDLVGFILLFPFTRGLVVTLVLAYFRKKLRDGQIQVYPSYPFPPNIPDYDNSDNSDECSHDEPPSAVLTAPAEEKKERPTPH